MTCPNDAAAVSVSFMEKLEEIANDLKELKEDVKELKGAVNGLKDVLVRLTPDQIFGY